MGAYKREIERCFRKYYRALCFYALRHVEDPDKAEDLVQDCFVRLLERELAFDSEAHMKNYLYAAVRNGCLNFLRDSRAMAFPPLRKYCCPVPIRTMLRKRSFLLRLSDG